MELQLQTPRVFSPLLAHSRYKAIYGGRGSGKSHDRAEALIERCLLKKTDWVCLREVQKTLDQSVKKLLEAKIERFGVGHLFEVQQNKIKCPYGGVITFQGMADHTAESIKSLEGFDGAWFEEAQTMSQRSLDLLRPTIRKEGSELWFTFNPTNETDPVDQFFRKDPPPDSIIVNANYHDNPWFPEVLKGEMEWDKARDYDKYKHIWLGEYNLNPNSRVFRNWRVEEFEAEPGEIFRLGADWGFSVDPSVLVRCFIKGNNLYVDYEAYMIGCEIVNLPELFLSVPDSEKWPITADSARPETISHMRKNGFPRMREAIKGAKSIEEGINFLQSFDIIVHPRCKHTIDELTLYSYKVDPLTGDVLPILVDKDNHCIAEGVLVSTSRGDIPIENVRVGDYAMTRKGYRKVLFSGITDVDRDILEIRANKTSLFCTPDHEIWTENRGFIKADALSYNDELILLESSLCKQSRRKNIMAKYTDVIQKVKEGLTGFILSALRPYCIGRYGKTKTARYLKDFISTIRTETRQITTFQTLSYCPQLTIGTHIHSQSNNTCDKLTIWSGLGRLQRHGIQAKKASKSIGRLGQWLTCHLFRLKRFVVNAACRSSQKNLAILINIARTNAGQSSAGLPVLMIFVLFAHVAKSLWQISTVKPKHVLGRALTITYAGKVSRVYDLTIEGEHEFFANGVLVHNCIDALRYGCEGARRIKPRAPQKEIEYARAGWMQ